MAVFLPESRVRSTKVGMSKVKLRMKVKRLKIKTVLSTTVAELYSFMKRFGACQFLRGLWMDLSGEVA